MPRFVLLHHESPEGSHYDLMLEAGDALRTWSIPGLPEPGQPLACRSLPDHRSAYLDYEGPVSDNRGDVVRWDQGTYEVIEQTSMRWVIELHGQKLDGRATFAATSTHDDKAKWTLLYVGRPTVHREFVAK